MNRLINLIFGKCNSCGKYFKYPKVRRRNTAYQDDKLNFTKTCKMCYDKQEEYWKERWDEYNSGRY